MFHLQAPTNANFNSFFFVPDDETDDSSSGSSHVDLETKMELTDDEQAPDTATEHDPAPHSATKDEPEPIVIGKKISPFSLLIGYKQDYTFMYFFAESSSDADMVDENNNKVQSALGKTEAEATSTGAKLQYDPVTMSPLSSLPGNILS